MVKTLLLSNIIDQKSHPNVHKSVMVVKYCPPLCPLLISCIYFRLHSAEEQLLALDLKRRVGVQYVARSWVPCYIFNNILNPIRGLRDLQIDNS